MKDESIAKVLASIGETNAQWKETALAVVARKRSPFQVLISCIISLRTKDEVTGAASRRLYALADNPADMLGLTPGEVEEAIFPAGFYRRKAATILDICRVLVDRYGSEVPDEIDELLKLKGVGRKTANLVVTLGFNKPGICVDTHVHRITNRWGYVNTRTPDETERVLRRKLPPQYWIEINDLLVSYGQKVCVPVSPFCSRCPIADDCDKAGVERSR